VLVVRMFKKCQLVKNGIEFLIPLARGGNLLLQAG